MPKVPRFAWLRTSSVRAVRAASVARAPLHAKGVRCKSYMPSGTGARTHEQSSSALLHSSYVLKSSACARTGRRTMTRIVGSPTPSEPFATCAPAMAGQCVRQSAWRGYEWRTSISGGRPSHTANGPRGTRPAACGGARRRELRLGGCCRAALLVASGCGRRLRLRNNGCSRNVGAADVRACA